MKTFIEVFVLIISGALFVTEVVGPVADRALGHTPLSLLVTCLFSLALGWTMAGLYRRAA